MQKTNKFQIRTGGFAFWLMSILICFFGLCFIGVIVQVLTKGFGEDGPFVTLLVLMLFIYFIGYFICFINGNRIVLDGEYLTVYDSTMHSLKDRRFPYNTGLMYVKPIETKISLKKIDHVILGNYHDLKKIDKSGVDQYLNDGLSSAKNLDRKYPFMSVGMKFAAKFTPILLIMEKNNKKHYVCTKPYSKRGFRKLMWELSERQLKVLVADKIL